MKPKYTEIPVEDALEAEFDDIVRKAQSLDLDCTGLAYGQFRVVRDRGEVIGFGRVKQHEGFNELATVGVIPEQQGRGIGSSIIHSLLEKAGGEVYVVTVIPGFFSRFGFGAVKDFPAVFLSKCEFCHSFGFKEGEVFVMKKTISKNV